MRRSTTSTTGAALTALLVGLLAVPAAAQPPPEAPSAQVTRWRSQDSVAIAVWSTCPEPVASETLCHETFVQANAGADGDVVLYSESTFLLGPDSSELLEFTNLSGPAVVSIAQQLEAASVRAPLEGFRCTVLPDFEVDCEEVEAGDLAADFVAIGALERIVDTSTPAPGAGRQDPLFVSTARYGLRDASAEATLAGQPVPGSLVFGQLAWASGSDLLVCRGGPALQGSCDFGP